MLMHTLSTYIPQVNLICEYHFLVFFCALLPTRYQVSKILYLVSSKNNDIDMFIFIRENSYIRDTRT